MDASTKVKIRRAIAVLIGTGALLIFIVTYFAFPDANQKLGAALVVAMLLCYVYALFPGLHPGQARWDALDRETAGKSIHANTPDARTEAKPDG